MTAITTVLITAFLAAVAILTALLYKQLKFNLEYEQEEFEKTQRSDEYEITD